MKFVVAIFLLSIVFAVDAPTSLKLDLLSGSSIRISWDAVEGASSYTVTVQPEPTLRNTLTVSTNYAFVDGLVEGQEYVLRVSASVHGVTTPFSNELKVTPSGAPIIAPAPHIVSYDENSVTLSRHHIRHYRNHNDFNKIFVRVTEESGTSRELEFAFALPLKITGLTSGKSYTFAWRFGNNKGIQQTYSRNSPSVTLRAPGNPEPPRYLHVNRIDNTLFIKWRMLHSGGRPIIKFNIRVSDLTGTVLYEKASYKSHIAFHNVPAVTGVKVEVNTMTSAGISEWSQPYVYSLTNPTITIMSVTAHDVVATAHVNITAPGTVMCSYYSKMTRPVFAQRMVHHAGHAHLLLQDLQEETEYSVECSLNTNTITVQSTKQTFTTQSHTASHLTVNDIETYSTFARVTLQSETPGEVLCMHHNEDEFRGRHHPSHHHHTPSYDTFRRFAKKLYFKEAGEQQVFTVSNLHRGMNYRLQCMMEHEYQRSLHQEQSLNRRLVDSDEIFSLTFQTQLQSFDEKPKVIRISPETPSEVHENTLVTITFDTPVTRKTGTVYIGSSVSAITTPISLSSVEGLVATFTLPTMTAGRVYLTIPEDTVQSIENGLGNEESRFNTNTFWTYTEVSEENTCELISTVIPRTNGIIRFTCNQPVYLPSTCTVMIANQQFTSSSIQINGNSFAFLPVIDSLTVNTEYPITFTQCNINTQAAITISTDIPIPSLISVQPSLQIFAGETYSFNMKFDGPVTLLQVNSMQISENAKLLTTVPITTVSPTTLQFIFTAPHDGTYTFTLKKENLQDDLQRTLPSDIVFSRIVKGSCGPSYLASLSNSNEICHCLRSADMCECDCGDMGASMQY